MAAEGKSRHRPRRWLELFVEHWVLSAILPILPGWIGLALRYYGPGWGLVSTDKPTTICTVLLAVLAIGSFAFALAKSAGVRFDLNVRKNNDFVLSRLLEAMNSVTRAKLNRFSAYVRDKPCPLPNHPFEDITQPETQIERILQCLQEALGDLMGTGSANVSVSLACEHDGCWHWLGRINADSDLHFGELTTNRNTAFHHVMVARSDRVIFYPDKRKAIADQKYIPSLQDSEDRGREHSRTTTGD